MNTRFLFALSLMILIGSVAYYRGQDNVVSDKPTQSVSNIDYQANDILALQTTDSGVTNYALTAEQLTHYTDRNVDELVEMTLHYRSATGQIYRMMADNALMAYDTKKLTMSNNVIIANAIDTPSSSKSSINLYAKELVGNLSDNTLISHTPVKVVQDKNEFMASSMIADLNSGEYDFQQVAITFMPPKRQDQPLF